MIDKALIERVRSGEGADSCLDMDIEIAIGAFVNSGTIRPFSTDLSAVLALIAEKLPNLNGYDLSFVGGNEPAYDASLWFELVREPTREFAASLTRALLAAALTALLALNAKDDADDR